MTRSTPAGKPESSATLQIALDALAAHPSLHLFPVKFGNKAQPLLKNYLALASNKPAQIRKWHAHWMKQFKGQGCWWGVAPSLSGLVIADIDTKEGKRGQHTFDVLELLYGWPRTRVITTPSGGNHRWYKGHHLFALGTAASNHPGIDFPQYVILPGCTKPDGTGYQVLDDFRIADAPAWIYAEARRIEKTVEATEQTPVIDLDQPSNIAWTKDFLLHDAPPSISGQGGEKTTFGVATILKDMGISEDTAVELMAEYYNVPGKCEPLWDLDEVPPEDSLTVKVHNAFAYNLRLAPGASTAEFEFADDDFVSEPLDNRTAAIVERQKLRRIKTRLDKANGIRPRPRSPLNKKRVAALKLAAAMARPYRSKN